MECLGHINEILYQDYKSLIYIEENRINLSINQIVEELDFVYILIIEIYKSNISSIRYWN